MSLIPAGTSKPPVPTRPTKDQFSISFNDILKEIQPPNPNFSTMSTGGNLKPLAPSTAQPAATVQPPAAVQTPTQAVQPMQTPIAPPALQPIGFDQFAQPYEEYTNQLFQGRVGQLQQNLRDTAEKLSQKLYGQNVGIESGIGTENVGRFLEAQTQQLAPYAQELSGKVGLQAIQDYQSQLNRAGLTATGNPTLDAVRLQQDIISNNRNFAEDVRRFDIGSEQDARNFVEKVRQFGIESGFKAQELGLSKDQFLENKRRYDQEFTEDQRRYNEDRLNEQSQRLFELVRAGQITGSQADNILRENGLNPEFFISEKELERKAESDRLDQLLENVPPKIRDRINTLDEFNRYIEFGKTFEDDVADVMQTSKSLKEWEKEIPTLKKWAAYYDGLIQRELGKKGALLPWDQPNEGRIAEWKEKKAAMEQSINEIKAGKEPIIEKPNDYVQGPFGLKVPL